MLKNRTMRRTALLSFFALLLAPTGGAQDPESLKAAVGFMQDPKPGLGGGATLGRIDEDWYLNINLGLTLDLGKIGLGLRAPLRLRLQDRSPRDTHTEVDLRHEDWDEPHDYLRLLRFVRYGRKGDPLHARVGDLWGVSLGHGTIMQRYYNNLDLNHFRLGGMVEINADWGGFEAVASDGTESGVYGGRFHLRPFRLIDASPLLGPLAVGVSAVVDPTAPYELADGTGAPVRDLSTQKAAVDGDGWLEVYDREAARVYGIDVEYTLPDLGPLRVTPYVDLNRIESGGKGLHAGVLGRFALPILSVDCEARFEYREMDRDYLPAYFNSYYEIQRYNFPFVDKLGTFGLGAGTLVDAIPKRMALEHLDRGDLRGWYGEVRADVMGLLQVGAAYDDYAGPENSNVRAFASAPLLESFKLNAYYLKYSFDKPEEALEFDDRSLLLVEGLIPLNAFLSLAARYVRTWELNRARGKYEPVADWSVGVVFSWEF